MFVVFGRHVKKLRTSSLLVCTVHGQRKPTVHKNVLYSYQRFYSLTSSTIALPPDVFGISAINVLLYGNGPFIFVNA